MGSVKQRIKQWLPTLLIMVVAAFLVVPLPAGAQGSAEVCEGVGAVSGGANCGTPADAVSVNRVIGVAVNILSVVVGIAAVIMIMIGGFKYVTSGGDSSSISSAKQTITYALVGVVFAALAQFLVRFVLARATGVPLPVTP